MNRIKKTPFFEEVKQDFDFVFGNDKTQGNWKHIDDVPVNPKEIFQDHDSILLTVALASKIVAKKEEEIVPEVSMCPVKGVHVIALEGCASVIPLFDDVVDNTDLIEEMVYASLNFNEEKKISLSNGKAVEDRIYTGENRCRSIHMKGRQYRNNPKDNKIKILRGEERRTLGKTALHFSETTQQEDRLEKILEEFEEMENQFDL